MWSIGGSLVHIWLLLLVYVPLSLQFVPPPAHLVPSLSPLQYITPQVVAQYVIENGENTLWSLLLPVDQQDAVAIFLSEGVSGFLGGVAAKGVSLIDGNKNNRQSSLANGEFSGAYFGTAAAIRSLASLAGLSSIFVNLSALLFASAISEFLKIRSMSIAPKRTRVGKGPTMYDLMKFKNPSMADLMKFAKNENALIEPRMKMMGEITQTEIYADLVKYFFIYCVVPRGLMVRLEDAVVMGLVAGTLSQLVREQKDREIDDSIRQARVQQRIAMQKQQEETLRRSRLGWTGKLQLAISGNSGSSSGASSSAGGSSRSIANHSPSSSKKGGSWMPKMPMLDDDPMVRPELVFTRFARSALETATQLVTYEAARRYVMEVAPYFQRGIEVEELNNLLMMP